MIVLKTRAVKKSIIFSAGPVGTFDAAIVVGSAAEFSGIFGDV